MYRGTTPSISLSVTGLSDIELHSAYLTVKQRSVVIEKTLDDMMIAGDTLEVTLSQKETLRFCAGLNAEIQLRCLSKNDVAYASDVLTVPVDRILKDGEIT